MGGDTGPDSELRVESQTALFPVQTLIPSSLYPDPSPVCDPASHPPPGVGSIAHERCEDVNRHTIVSRHMVLQRGPEP